MTAGKTVACPACGETYPLLPKLIGRALRCRACKKPFRIHEDGTAEAIVKPALPPPPAAEPVAESAPAPRRAAEPAAESAPAPRPAAEQPPAEQPAARQWSSSRTRSYAKQAEKNAAHFSSGKNPVAEQVSKRVSAARRKVESSGMRSAVQAKSKQLQKSLTGNLNSLAQEALDAIAVEPEKPASNRHARQSPSSERFEAVTTGSGAEQGKEQRRWLIGCGTVVIILAVILLVQLRSSPQRQALAAFTDQAHGGTNLVQSIAHQQILGPGSLHPITHIDDARIGTVTDLPLHRLIDLVGDLRPVERGRLWAASDQLDAVRTAWLAAGRPAIDQQDFARQTKKAGWQVLTAADLRRQVEGLGHGGNVLADLLLAPPPTNDFPDFTGQLLIDRPPRQLRIAHFNGTDGVMHVLNGTSLETDFTGILLSADGEGWPTGWRVIRLRPAGD